MNVEIGARLAELRRENGLSQEELAAKLGLSRQAVSKWERAESSPDTDNLIALANLYGVSLDELLKMDDAQREDADFATKDRKKTDTGQADDETETDTPSDGKPGREYAYVGPKGIHVKDDSDEVHIDWHGIHVSSAKDGEVHVDKNGVNVNGEHYTMEEAHKKWSHRDFDHQKNWMQRFPYPVLCTIIFICLGTFGGWWHPGWVVFLTIPLWYGIAEAAGSHKQKD